MLEVGQQICPVPSGQKRKTGRERKNKKVLNDSTWFAMSTVQLAGFLTVSAAE